MPMAQTCSFVIAVSQSGASNQYCRNENRLAWPLSSAFTSPALGGDEKGPHSRDATSVPHEWSSSHSVAAARTLDSMTPAGIDGSLLPRGPALFLLQKCSWGVRNRKARAASAWGDTHAATITRSAPVRPPRAVGERPRACVCRGLSCCVATILPQRCATPLPFFSLHTKQKLQTFPTQSVCHCF